MAASTRVFNAELRFIQEIPGGASKGERPSLIQSHIARVRHRRLRDANRTAFHGGKNEGERKGKGKEGEGEGEGKETRIDTANRDMAVTETNLARFRLQLPLS